MLSQERKSSAIRDLYQGWGEVFLKHSAKYAVPGKKTFSELQSAKARALHGARWPNANTALPLEVRVRDEWQLAGCCDGTALGAAPRVAPVTTADGNGPGSTRLWRSARAALTWICHSRSCSSWTVRRSRLGIERAGGAWVEYLGVWVQVCV